MRFLKQKVAYLDYAAGSPICPSAKKATKSLLKGFYVNPASMHDFGVRSKLVLEESRKIIAKSLDTKSDNIVFTSSGTESIALAILGTVFAYKSDIVLPHIITTTIEHSAVIENCKFLEENNLAEVTYLHPDYDSGIINPEKIINAIKDNTVLISIHMVNSEIGVIQDINKVIKQLNAYKEKKYNIENMRFVNSAFLPYLHVDAAQAYAHLDLGDIVKKGIDLISFNSSKIGGLYGAGALYKKSNLKLTSFYKGGSQEFGLRPGTVNIFSIYSFAMATKELKKNLEKNEIKYKNLKYLLLEGLREFSSKTGIDIIENSSAESVPSIVSLSFPYFSGAQMAIELNARGVEVSSKSACNTKSEEESYVVKELRNISGNNTYNNYGTIRVSFGEQTKEKDIKKLLKALYDIAAVYRGVLY